jgi:hypothetical protein
LVITATTSFNLLKLHSADYKFSTFVVFSSKEASQLPVCSQNQFLGLIDPQMHNSIDVDAFLSALADFIFPTSPQFSYLRRN